MNYRNNKWLYIVGIIFFKVDSIRVLYLYKNWVGIYIVNVSNYWVINIIVVLKIFLIL